MATYNYFLEIDEFKKTGADYEIQRMSFDRGRDLVSPESIVDLLVEKYDLVELAPLQDADKADAPFLFSQKVIGNSLVDYKLYIQRVAPQYLTYDEYSKIGAKNADRV